MDIKTMRNQELILQNKNINNSNIKIIKSLFDYIKVRIDDLDLCFNYLEYSTLCKEACEIINSIVDVKGFDIKNIDYIYFEDMLSKDILHLNRVKLENVQLEDLLVSGYDGVKPLKISRCVKAINKDYDENNKVSTKQLKNGETNNSRIQDIYKSINKHNYPYKKQYIILYGDDYLIRDGQHRASSLYCQRGNITIPIMRMYFDNYDANEVKNNSYNRSVVMKKIDTMLYFIGHPKYMIKTIRNVVISIIAKISNYPKDKYIEEKRNEIEIINDIFDNK